MGADLRIGVINYGAGNIGNVLRALQRLHLPYTVHTTPDELERASQTLLLLPGVGAFRPAMARLQEVGWHTFLEDWAHKSRPLLGICIGMQLLCTGSEEDGVTAGLGLLEGKVERLTGISKIPHMGWNTVEWKQPISPEQGAESFYFVHSYAVRSSPDCAAETQVDDLVFCSALRSGNVAGFQFHPERSGLEGVAFLGSAIRRFHDVYCTATTQEGA